MGDLVPDFAQWMADVLPITVGVLVAVVTLVLVRKKL